VRVSYAPLVSVTGVKAKYARRRHEHEASGFELEYAAAFATSSAGVDVDLATVTVNAALGELRFAESAFAPGYREVEVSYTAGFAEVPQAVKVACAQVVRNAQAMPGTNVKSSRMDALQMEYFSDSLLSAEVRAMLRPFVAERLG
jgi:hypothetical protein